MKSSMKLDVVRLECEFAGYAGGAPLLRSDPSAADLVEAVGQVLKGGGALCHQVFQITAFFVVAVGGGHAVGEFDVLALVF